MTEPLPLLAPVSFPQKNSGPKSLARNPLGLDVYHSMPYGPGSSTYDAYESYDSPLPMPLGMGGRMGMGAKGGHVAGGVAMGMGMGYGMYGGGMGAGAGAQRGSRHVLDYSEL